MGENIFELWMDNGKRVPFAVRRNNWSDAFWTVVEEVRIRRWPYGEARGYPVANGVPNDHYEYDSDWRREKLIPCAGCYQWSLADVGLEGRPSSEEEGAAPPKPKRKKKPKLLGADSLLGFGKYKDQRLTDVLSTDPSYVGWMLRTIETVVIDPTMLAALSDEVRNTIGADGIALNAMRVEQR